MSKYFTEGNKETTFNLFNKRQIYRGRAIESVPSVRNIVDFNMAERRYFGKVDYFFSPIYIREDSFFKPLRTGGELSNNFVAVNFVADLFNEMSLQFDKCVATGQIAKDDPYLSSLRVYKAYVDPVKSYRDYQKIVFASAAEYFKENNVEIENFDHFLKELQAILPNFTKTMPFTFPAYIKSRENPMTTSGLTIEIADLPYDNDEQKKELFLKSRNWQFFVNACNKYGFLIDYNVPWRIVCDIKAEEILPLVNQYFGNSSALLSEGYSKASMYYVTTYVGDLLRLYNMVTKSLIIKTSYCDGKLRRTKIKPPRYTVEEIKRKYTIRFFVKLYMKMRLWEEKPDMTQHQKNKLMKDVLIYTTSWTGSWLSLETHFEKFINKPFDKPYSFTYNTRVAIPARKNASTQRANERAGFGVEPASDGTTSGY